ncbi:MAG: anti-sigma factor [Myxococcota bacterium]
MITCELFQRHVGAFVDGELDPATQIDFEQHLANCEHCAEHVRFEGTYRKHVQAAMPPVAAPASLRERVLVNLDQASPAADNVVQVVPLRLRYALPLAGAAAVALAVGAAVNTDVEQAGVAALEDVVRLQSAQLPADVTVEAPAAPVQRVSSYFRDKVEFPVRPAEFASRDIRLVGARLSNVRERRAAALYYEVQGGHRLTVVVTDASVDEPEPTNQGVVVRDVRGYPVGVRTHAGLTYAFTGDVDRDTLARLATSARVRY